MKQDKLLLILCGVLAVLLIIAALLPKQTDNLSTQQPGQTVSEIHRANKLVGICLPAQTDAWQDAGHLLKSKLESAGYRVELSFADGTAQGQSALLKTLLDQGVNCLIAAPADSAAMTEAEDASKAKGVPLLAYGSLLMDTDAVSGYICYNYYEMGADIAKYVLSQLQIGDKPATIELFMGSAKNYNALLLHRGLLSVLQPYIDSGKLIAASGRLDFEDCCIPNWSADAAKQACLTRLENSYPAGAPDVCICASDTIAAGVIAALETKGVPQENWPMITGNGATDTGTANLTAGKQALTVRLDAANPAGLSVAMVDRALFGTVPDFPLGEIFNNVINVPTAYCDYELLAR